MPQLNEPARKVRFRIDIYDKALQNYRPYKGKTLIVPLANLNLHRPLWRAFVKWMETGAWKAEITETEREAVNAGDEA